MPPGQAERSGLRLALLDGRGQRLPDELAAGRLLDQGELGFFHCAELSGLVLDFPAPTAVAALRLHFLGCAPHDTWNSWLRAPIWPEAGAITVENEAVIEQRTRAPRLAGTTPADGLLVELSLPPGLRTALTLRFPPGPYALSHVEVAAQAGPMAARPDDEVFSGPFAPAAVAPALPAPHGDALGAALLASAADPEAPTLGELQGLALPYRGGALLGIPDGPCAYQLWDGGLLLPHRQGKAERALLKLALLPAPDGAPLATTIFPPPGAVQRLREGYLPVGEVESGDAGHRIAQQAFVGRDGALHARFHVENHGPRPLLPRLVACLCRRITGWNAPKQQAELHEPLPVRSGAAALFFGEIAVGELHGLPVRLEPGETADLELRIPLAKPGPGPATHVAALEDLERDCAQFLDAGLGFELPDPQLRTAARALLLQNRLYSVDGSLRYGRFPGLYDGAIFGIEEGWNIVAFAMYGQPRLAETLLRRTFFDPEFLKKEGPHHQYRSGLCITYALDVASLSGERGQTLLTELWPLIRDNAEWILASLRSTAELIDGQRPVHFGLMPRHIYGGDLRDPAYSLYATAACWRGLRDAGLIAERLRDPVATRYLEAAATARRHLHEAAERIYRRPQDPARPPYLPLRTDETADEPSSKDYYQLFVPLLLETGAFGWQGGFSVKLTDYLEKTGRLVLGVPRFDQWFGRLGVDAAYARGLQLAALHRRQFARFRLGLLGQLGLSCDPFTFTMPETAIVLRTSAEQTARLATLATQGSRADSDPCSAGVGVTLQYLRQLLVCEERDDEDLLTGTVLLGAGAPAWWFERGHRFALSRVPTPFGELSFRCESDERGTRYEVETSRPLMVEVFAGSERAGRRSLRRLVDGRAVLSLSR